VYLAGRAKHVTLIARWPLAGLSQFGRAHWLFAQRGRGDRLRGSSLEGAGDDLDAGAESPAARKRVERFATSSSLAPNRIPVTAGFGPARRAQFVLTGDDVGDDRLRLKPAGRSICRRGCACLLGQAGGSVSRRRGAVVAAIHKYFADGPQLVLEIRQEPVAKLRRDLPLGTPGSSNAARSACT
jgi:hypothetical protein